MARAPGSLIGVALLCALAPAAHADMAYAPPPPPPPPQHDFWRDVVTPHADEIQQILDKANQAFSYASQCANQDCDATGESRVKLLDDAYYMLRYARRLDPNQADVLLLLGKVAEESGRSTAAVEALEAYLGTLTPDETANAEAPLRLGRAYLRLGRPEDAIRQFRAASVTGCGGNGGAPCAALAYLGATLMNRGRIADAIDVLAPTAQFQYYYQAEPMQAVMTLAVAYDRDEQIGAAFTVIDSIQQSTSGSYAMYMQPALSSMEFSPSYDQHYYLGLFYESQGYLPEARTEWLLYASVPDAPFRGRALDHAAAIDKLAAQALKDKVKAAADAAKAAKAAKHGKHGLSTTPPQPLPPPPPPQPYYGP